MDATYHLSTTENWATFTKGRKWDFTIDLPIELGDGLAPIPVETWKAYLETERAHFQKSIAKKSRSLEWLKKNANQRRGQTFRPQKPKNVENKKLLNRRAYLKRKELEDDTWLAFPDYPFEDSEDLAIAPAMLFPAAIAPERRTKVDFKNKKWTAVISKKGAEICPEYINRLKHQDYRVKKFSRKELGVFWCVETGAIPFLGETNDRGKRRRKAFLLKKAGARAHQGVVFRAWKKQFRKDRKLLEIDYASDSTEAFAEPDPPECMWSYSCMDFNNE